jgi:hypothetical protein
MSHTHVYHCQCPAGTPSHPHTPCPVVQRWLSLACWGEGGIAGVCWRDPHPHRPGHRMILPVKEGALWCPPQHLHRSPLPVGVFLCLDTWVRAMIQEDAAHEQDRF